MLLRYTTCYNLTVKQMKLHFFQCLLELKLREYSSHYFAKKEVRIIYIFFK